MDEWESFDYNMKRQKPKKSGTGFRNVFIALLIGGLVGASSTGIYINNQVEDKIDDAISGALEEQQANFETQIDELKYTLTEETQSGGTSTTIETTSYSNNVQSVAEAVMPSVVGVRTIEEVEIPSNFFYNGGTQEQEGVGTGVIVSEDGLILTNQHVVSSNPKSITVTLMDGREYDATVIYSNEIMDLAVIKIEETGLPVAALGNSDAVTVGEVSIAIGNPLGLEYDRSVTAGIVSALDRSIQLDVYNFATNLIQTDAAINSGNSGGPLLNAAGEVIGINTYKLSSGEGMGFAIPINVAIPIVEQVKEYGSFTQAKLGASFIEQDLLGALTDQDKAQNGIDVDELEEGIFVTSVDDTSDAAAQGLEAGMIITYADGQKIDTLLDLRTAIHHHLPGETMELTVIDDGQTKTITAKLSDASN